VRRKVSLQALDDEFFAGAVGFGNQVEIALQLETDVAFQIVRDQRTRFASDIGGSFYKRGQSLELVKVFNIVLEQEQIRMAGAG